MFLVDRPSIIFVSNHSRNTSGSTVDMPGTLNALGTMPNSPGSTRSGITRARTPTFGASSISGMDRSSGSSGVGGGSISGGLRQSGSSSALSSLTGTNVDIGRTFEQGTLLYSLDYFFLLINFQD